MKNEVKQTTNYNLFKFRDDNRMKGVNSSHVECLKRSLQKKNMLKTRPIDVNKKFEILDGQHRFCAAKALGLPIFYRVCDDLSGEDMLLLNNVRSWKSEDYLNFYVKRGYADYVNLESVWKKSGAPLSFLIRLAHGRTIKSQMAFKSGDWKAPGSWGVIPQILELSDVIKALQTYSGWVTGTRVWTALSKIVRSDGYNHDHFIKNLQKYPSKIGPKATFRDYDIMFTQIYNKGLKKNRIDLGVADEGLDD